MSNRAAPERYLYHSFPRRRTAQGAETKGVQILRSMAVFGLVLTPERFEISEFVAGGGRREAVEVFQKRVSFTELSPTELPVHSERFGPFAIEFEIEQARHLGAMPVWYVPPPGEEDDLRGIGAAIQNRLYEVSEIFRRLVRLEQAVAGGPDPTVPVSITNPATGATIPTRLTIGGAADLLYYLRLELQRPELILNTLNAMAGLLYPTENLEHTELLDYYRQREWRILSAMTDQGTRLDTAVSDGLRSELLELDRDFWSKEIRFPTGVHAIVDQSRVLREVRKKHVLSYGRRVLVPSRRLVKQVSDIFRTQGLDIRIEVTGAA